MSWIIKITLGKSRSSSYSELVKIAQSLPNYSECDGIVTCGAREIREYVMYAVHYQSSNCPKTGVLHQSGAFAD